MPGTPTTPDGLRWPVDVDTPDVPRDIKNLADDVQAALIKRSVAFPLTYAYFGATISAPTAIGDNQLPWVLINQQGDAITSAAGNISVATPGIYNFSCIAHITGPPCNDTWLYAKGSALPASGPGKNPYLGRIGGVNHTIAAYSGSINVNMSSSAVSIAFLVGWMSANWYTENDRCALTVIRIA